MAPGRKGTSPASGKTAGGSAGRGTAATASARRTPKPAGKSPAGSRTAGKAPEKPKQPAKSSAKAGKSAIESAGTRSRKAAEPAGRSPAVSRRSAPPLPAVSPKPVPNLSEEEVGERVKVLKRFRELLQAQRARFQQYLEILENQKDLIGGDWAASSGDALEAQVNLEAQIVADIFAIQKVIDPLEAMYRTVYPAPKRRGRLKKDEESAGISGLKSALEELRGEAALMVERNKELLSQRMGELRAEIKSLAANPYRKGRSVYGETPAPSLIDIEG